VWYDAVVDGNVAKRWRDGHEAAARRALQVMRDEGPPRPSVAFREAMELCALVDVEPADTMRLREEREVRATWAKVRAWAARHTAKR